MPLSIQIGVDLSGIGGAASSAPSPPPVTGFKFSVDTSKAGSANDTFVLPLVTSGTYDFEVDWGDSTTDTITSWNQSEKTHVYSASGIYTIECTGTLEQFVFALAVTVLGDPITRPTSPKISPSFKIPTSSP